MVTASHNPNGWTGVKLGMEPPLTHGPEEMARLSGIVLDGAGRTRPGGSWRSVGGLAGAYLADLANGPGLSRRLKVVCACGNGGAGMFAPRLLRRLGAEVVELHCTPDYTFPRYNPNPEALEMLRDMARAVSASGADLGLGLDGDGDRCGVVDDAGAEIFADKMGVLLARDWLRDHPGASFVVDVKSTALFATDPGLAGARIDYWKTGHSHMKRRLRALGALAGFEKSGHVFLAPPLGRGYDDGLRAALEICRLLDRHPAERLSDLALSLPPTWTSPTLSPACPDAEKYAVAERLAARLEAMAAGGGSLAGRRVAGITRINGARVSLEGGAWALIRPSSNTPNLVVVCESPNSGAELRAVFEAVDALLRAEPAVGAYDQRL
jgi:phosphomannomutase/phosphoglucomutase